jgi:hypothetical protein
MHGWMSRKKVERSVCLSTCNFARDRSFKKRKNDKNGWLAKPDTPTPSMITNMHAPVWQRPVLARPVSARSPYFAHYFGLNHFVRNECVFSEKKGSLELIFRDTDRDLNDMTKPEEKNQRLLSEIIHTLR